MSLVNLVNTISLTLRWASIILIAACGKLAFSVSRIAIFGGLRHFEVISAVGISSEILNYEPLRREDLSMKL